MARRDAKEYEAHYWADKPEWVGKESADLAQTCDEHGKTFGSRFAAVEWLRREKATMGVRWRGGEVHLLDSETYLWVGDAVFVLN